MEFSRNPQRFETLGARKNYETFNEPIEVFKVNTVQNIGMRLMVEVCYILDPRLSNGRFRRVTGDGCRAC